MKSNYKLLAGVLAGVTGSSAIHGQQARTPPAYVISEAEAITDPMAMKEYGAKAPQTLAPFNGHFVVRGSKTESLDGDAPPKGIVVIAFDNSEQAHAWYNSPAYAAIRPIRQAAMKGRMFIVGGVAPYSRCDGLVAIVISAILWEPCAFFRSPSVRASV